MQFQGYGIEVKIDGKNILLEIKNLMDEKNISLDDLEETSDKLASEGKTPMYIAIDGKLSRYNSCCRYC